ncbi:transposase [Streptomyces sp. So13.3]|nr:transposase [Streptomyces sp. So13.3]
MAPLSKYSPEFRDEAVQFALRSSKTISEVARDLDLNPETLRGWVKKHEKQLEPTPDTELTVPGRARLKELERRNRELEMEVSFLKEAALDSTGQGNTLCRCAESQALARTVVELRRDGVKIVLAERRQVRPPGQVLPEQFVRVLVGATLPGAARGCEEHVNTRSGGELLVRCQFHAAIPGQGGV